MLKDSLKTIILSAVALFLMGVAHAWTEPSQSPPLGNVSAPITTSGAGQTKTGSLEVNGLWNRGTTILDGNVGIGTTNPGNKLDVSGGEGTTPKISFGIITQAEGGTQINAGTYNLGRSRIWSTWDDNFNISTFDDTPNPNWIIGIGDGAGGWSGNKYMRMDANGNVGIGTMAPGQKLSVAGTIESTSGGIKFPDGSTQATAAPQFSWGGAYRGIGGCGCQTPNQFTGSCSCPAGYSAVWLSGPNDCWTVMGCQK